MSYYWAKFEENNDSLFRFDTRVYLKTINSPSDTDLCIGAVVGKNPGSALPSCHTSNVLQKIDLDNDNLLPNIRSIMKKAYLQSNKPIPKSAYIQVLNLLYICDSKLDQAIKKIKRYSDPIICDSEKRNFPFLWYLWGGDNEELNTYKERYTNINSNIHFYFDKDRGEIVSRVPGFSDWARHTQGLSHELVVPFISKLIYNS